MLIYILIMMENNKIFKKIIRNMKIMALHDISLNPSVQANFNTNKTSTQNV